MGSSLLQHRMSIGCYASRMSNRGWHPGSSGNARCNTTLGRNNPLCGGRIVLSLIKIFVILIPIVYLFSLTNTLTCSRGKKLESNQIFLPSVIYSILGEKGICRTNNLIRLLPRTKMSMVNHSLNMNKIAQQQIKKDIVIEKVQI